MASLAAARSAYATAPKSRRNSLDVLTLPSFDYRVGKSSGALSIDV